MRFALRRQCRNHPRQRTEVSRATGFATRLCSPHCEGPATSYPRPPDLPGEGGEDGEDEDANDEEEWPDEPKLEEGDRGLRHCVPHPARGSQCNQHHFAVDR